MLLPLAVSILVVPVLTTCGVLGKTGQKRVEVYLTVPVLGLLFWWGIPHLAVRLGISLLTFWVILRLTTVFSLGVTAAAEAFQRELLAGHYQEVRDIYLQMRGWRHDYHNHLQTLKAALQSEKFDFVETYLNELEQSWIRLTLWSKAAMIWLTLS